MHRLTRAPSGSWAACCKCGNCTAQHGCFCHSELQLQSASRGVRSRRRAAQTRLTQIMAQGCEARAGREGVDGWWQLRALTGALANGSGVLKALLRGGLLDAACTPGRRPLPFSNYHRWAPAIPYTTHAPELPNAALPPLPVLPQPPRCPAVSALVFSPCLAALSAPCEMCIRDSPYAAAVLALQSPVGAEVGEQVVPPAARQVRHAQRVLEAAVRSAHIHLRARRRRARARA